MERKSYSEVAKICGKKKKSFICKIVQKEKGMCASFAVTFQPAKVWPQSWYDGKGIMFIGGRHKQKTCLIDY